MGEVIVLFIEDGGDIALHLPSSPERGQAELVMFGQIVREFPLRVLIAEVQPIADVQPLQQVLQVALAG